MNTGWKGDSGNMIKEIKGDCYYVFDDNVDSEVPSWGEVCSAGEESNNGNKGGKEYLSGCVWSSKLI